MRVTPNLKQTISVAAALAVLVIPAVALAAGDGEAGVRAFPWSKIILKGVNLVLLFTILYFALRGTVRQFLAQRRSDIVRELDRAAEARREAEALLAEFKKKMETIDEEARRLREDIVTDGEAEKQRLIEQGRRQADHIVAEARRAAEREVAQARTALKAEAVRLAAELAAERLQKEITDEDRRRFNERFLSKLEKIRQ